MAGLRIEGYSGVVPEVDSYRNLNVTTPSTTDPAGYVMLGGELGSSSDPTGRVTTKIRTSAQGRLTVGQPVCLLNEMFNYTTLNSAIFTAPVTTFAIAQASGYMTLNSGNVTTANAVARVSTYAAFPIFADMALYATWDMILTQAPQVNNVVEVGFFQASGTTAPIDGAFFRYTTTGLLHAIVNINGTEYLTVVSSTPSANIAHKYKIIIENDSVLFYIDEVLVAIIANPTTYNRMTYVQSQPWTVREYNGASAPAISQQVKISCLFIGMQDYAGNNKPYSHLAAIGGRMSSQGQSGQTMGSTALYTNNLAVIAAGSTGTNTTAAAGSGLGGQFSLTAVSLVVAVDTIISSYQNPAATIAIPGKQLYITGVKVTGIVGVVLAATQQTIVYTLNYGHTAVSLATTESATSKAPRRIPIGAEAFAASAAVGTLGSATGQYLAFNSPICINPGEFIAVSGKSVAAAPATGAYTFFVSFDGYWE